MPLQSHRSRVQMNEMGLIGSLCRDDEAALDGPHLKIGGFVNYHRFVARVCQYLVQVKLGFEGALCGLWDDQQV